MARSPSSRVAVLIGLAACAPLWGQRAQLARTGRQAERGAPAVVEPVRKLPRKTAGGLAVGPAEQLPQYIDAQRGLEQGRPLAEDRSGPLMHGAAGPLPTEGELGNPEHTLPRTMVMVAGVPMPVAGAQASAIRNRWHIFPPPPWRRYDSEKLDAIYAYSRWWDPFNRSTLKGDFPFFGRREFFSFTGSSETLTEERRGPGPAGASYADPGEMGVFGRGAQVVVGGG